MKKPFTVLAMSALIGAPLALGFAAPADAAVPREYKNALASAQDYVRYLDISEQGLYDQLTSAYGGKFPAAAAKYALKHVHVNYKKEALAAAKSYEKTLHLSDDALFDQLTSEYGSQFTASQAHWAIAHLG